MRVNGVVQRSVAAAPSAAVNLSAPVAVGLLSSGGMLAAVYWPDEALPRLACGFVLAAFAPGYALLYVAQPTGIGAVERLTLSVPLSLVFVVLVATFFDHTAFGLAATPIVLTVWGMTGVLLAVGCHRLVGTRRATFAIGGFERNGRGLMELAIGGTLVAAAAWWAATSISQAAHAEPKAFTSLSVQGTANADVNSDSDSRPPTIIIANQEGQAMTYDLEVDVDGDRTSWLPGLQIEAGAQYAVAEPAIQARIDAVDVVLYRANELAPYRRLHIPRTYDVAP
jgi:hypothetical protein